MRTIKFRGKGVTIGKWHYGDFVKCNGNTFIATYNEIERTCRYTTEDIHIDEVIPKTVCQFVIRHNGNDIYEHDLILFCGLLCEVVYDSERCCFCLLYIKQQSKVIFSIREVFRLYDYELVGNVFDNL